MSIAHRGSVSEGLPAQRPRVRSVAPSAPRACSMAKEHNAHFFLLSTPCALCSKSPRSLWGDNLGATRCVGLITLRLW